VTNEIKNKAIQKAKIRMLQQIENDFKLKEKYGADRIANWSIVRQLQKQIKATAQLTEGAK